MHDNVGAPKTAQLADFIVPICPMAQLLKHHWCSLRDATCSQSDDHVSVCSDFSKRFHCIRKRRSVLDARLIVSP